MSDVASTAAAGPPKQAVILVHGMGEQMPMDTLRSFVDAMWVHNPEINATAPGDPPDSNPVWWKPDPKTGSFELSRITTRAGHADTKGGERGSRNDFYEFYWADLTDANSIRQFRDWFMSLLWRRPSQVPSGVMSIWLILWFLTLGFGGLALWRVLAFIPNVHVPGWASTSLAFATAIYGVASGVVLSTFGDVARYVRAKPANIAARRAIRERGLALLRSIHDSGLYDRVILVGHSLGTIICYDLIKLYWAECDRARTMANGDSLHDAFQSCQVAAAALDQARPDEIAERRDAYRASQREVFRAMRDRSAVEERWLISDFVTVGSPLTHAQFLMAHDAEALKEGIAERRFPSCPPVAEEGNAFLYRPDPSGRPDAWEAHHAAAFAAVRWTNICDPPRSIIFGDPISGPVAGNFGRGVSDVTVTIRRTRLLAPTLFTHSSYWTATGSNSPQLDELRSAVDLLLS